MLVWPREMHGPLKSKSITALRGFLTKRQIEADHAVNHTELCPLLRFNFSLKCLKDVMTLDITFADQLNFFLLKSVHFLAAWMPVGPKSWGPTQC